VSNLEQDPAGRGDEGCPGAGKQPVPPRAEVVSLNPSKASKQDLIVHSTPVTNPLSRSYSRQH
jgi:hypothetical protein